MSLTPEAYNALRGQALTVLIMDTVRERTTTGEQLTMRTLAKQLADRYQLQNELPRRQLYHRVRATVRQLSNAGLLHTQKGWNPKHQVNITIITIPTNHVRHQQ